MEVKNKKKNTVKHLQDVLSSDFLLRAELFWWFPVLVPQTKGQHCWEGTHAREDESRAGKYILGMKISEFEGPLCE